MLKRIRDCLAVAAMAALSLVSTAPAGARAADAVPGARCVLAGVQFLVVNDLLVQPRCARSTTTRSTPTRGGTTA